MSRFFGWLSWVITVRPYITILILVIMTVLLAAGATRRAPALETASTLPGGNPVAQALDELDELFGDSGEASVVTLIFRGDAITPSGLSQMDSLISDIGSEPPVLELLAPDSPVIAPSLLIEGALQVEGFESVDQAQIDSVRQAPQIEAALEAMTGTDTDGTRVAIATIRLRDTGDERVEEAERRIHELATADQGPLHVSVISPGIVEDEYQRATEEGMAPLIGLALLLIAALILLFMRSISDLLLTLAGLFAAMIWIIGAEGWLGPNALGLTGPPNALTSIVPIILISLTVDFAIQIVSLYREQRLGGEGVVPAVRAGLRIVALPLTLAAVTTVVSLLVNLFSPIGIIRDFGIIAGMGVGMSLIVMLTLIPAGRTIIDRRREARGRLPQPRPISSALPGVGRMAEILGRGVTRIPGVFLLAVAAVVIGLGFAATDLESEFNIQDVLPRGGTVSEDIKTLDAAVGGSTEIATVLIKLEATETFAILNLRNLTNSFADEATRPGAAAGPIQRSFDLLVRDWTIDSGEPGDKYDAKLASLLEEASAGVELDASLMQEFLDRLEEIDPALSSVLVNNPDGIDAAIVEFPVYAADPGQVRLLQQEIENLWHGPDEDVTATSEGIIGVTVMDSITDRQTESISTTVAAALTVLAVFFWVTVRQPALALIAVGPIVLVLISVLGTMALLNIPYTIVTSIITALSIGIGVDYTIHIIHRYREEYTQDRDPERAAIQTLSTTGSALLGSALTTALGIGVLVASPLVASQQFGFTAAITIVYSLIVSVLVVPPLMTIWGAYQNMRLRSNMRRWAEELDEAMEAVSRRDGG